MDNEALVIPASRTKTFFLLVIALGFVALGLWFLSLDREVIEARDRYNNPLFIYGIGWATVLFFGLAAVAIAWRLISAKPALVLDDQGIRIFAMSQSTFIPWRDITGLAVFELQRTKMMVLKLNDPEKYIEIGGRIRRSLARANYNMCGSPITIASNTVKLSFGELQELVERYVNRYAVEHE